MILGTKDPNNNRMRLRKALFLESVEDEGQITSSHSCELGPDGIRFVRDNIKVTKNGMCKLSDDEITPLSIVNSEEIEVSNK